MRARFFWITFLALFVASLAAVGIHGWFLRVERIRLIDQQVRDTAETLLDSELGDLRRVNYERVEEIISEELGENRIGKFFVIRGAKNQVIYESASAKVLPLLELPQSPQWVTVEEKGQYIRVLNLSLPRIKDRTMQVGVVLDDGLVSAFPPLRRVAIFIAAALLIGLASAALLTSYLLRPISNLYSFIADLSRDEAPRGLPPLILSAHHRESRDEMSALLRGVARLIERVNRGHRTSRAWSFQMAHELKTPLAIIEAEITQAEASGAIPEKLASSVREELMQASSAVTLFLSWAELEEAPASGANGGRLYAQRIKPVVETLCGRLEKQFPSRLAFTAEENFTVLAAAQHLELLLSNLLRNALVHSGGAVQIRAGGSAVEITDNGAGLPAAVKDRLGEPFNKGPGREKGHGLGLALVAGICRRYGWGLQFSEAPGGGTCARVEFPRE
ncbi:MAG: HAMP domain-containing histidine kinase [Proteobacteria bacterium]|nr:MAG: HAMP domain-containing histidine kinase [Pseudomonadota bacterium]